MFAGLGNYLTNVVKGGNEQQLAEAEAKKQRKGNYEISYVKEDVEFEHLRRKRAFISGANIEPEQSEKEELISFDNLPDILPFKPKGTMADVDYAALMTFESEESKATATPGASGFDYDAVKDDADKLEQFMAKFELIRKRKIQMKQGEGKRVALIFNPSVTGEREDEIKDALFNSEKIISESIRCEADLDPYRKTLELDLDEYSALIAVGGDGTFNQMINGMLARDDGKRLPVGVIPTGVSNDMARSLGISTTDLANAISNIGKCEAIAVDTTRVLIDHDYESSVPKDDFRMMNCRHMLTNASLAMPARIANGSTTWKGCCGGSSAWSMSTYLQAFSCGFVQENYQLSIDDKPVNQEGISTALMMINNGKYANGGMIMNPFASINDGLIDITWISDPNWQGTFGVTGIMSDARANGGIQAYKGHSTYVRGRKIRIDVPQPAEETPDLDLELDNDAAKETPELPQQVIMIDGEALSYSKSILWECFPGNIEVLIDDSFFKDNGTFERMLDAAYENERIYAQAVDALWEKYDTDKSGQLDKEETKVFLKDVLSDIPPPNDYDEATFETTFNGMDKDRNGKISKKEMTYCMTFMLKKK